MPATQYLNRRDLTFWLFELGNAANLGGQGPYGSVDAEQIEAFIDTACKLAEQEFAGLAQQLDEQEPELVDGKVILPEQLSTALQAYIDNGFPLMGVPEAEGGLGLPSSVRALVEAPIAAIGGTTTGYLGLTHAACVLMEAVANEEQKQRYLKPMQEGRWFGTMVLSEPQAGSSLGDIRTTATAQADGSYHLKGSKMWISGGDQDISENIVHLVLAKIADADGVQSGSGGISLFLVPKYLLNDDDSLGQRNGFVVSGLNHKMGQRAIVNTAPVLGQDEPCVGYLVGQAGKGLKGMFHMMNEMRIHVGLSAAIWGWAGFRYSLEYAKQRPQGRALTNTDPASPQTNIIEHTDVKRMLLAQKAYAEGAMALCHYAAELFDQTKIGADVEQTKRYQTWLDVLTPVVKTWPSGWCLEANKLAIQVLGGYGYTREYPLERLYRDNRLNEIHEGTTGIQGLDLLGRKVLKDGGVGLADLLTQAEATIQQANEQSNGQALQAHAQALTEALARIRQVVDTLMGCAMQGDIDRTMANSTVFLDQLGTTMVAWMWLRMAVVAKQALNQGAAEVDVPFYQGKLTACQYFYHWELPKTQQQAELLKSLDDSCLQAQAEQF